MLKLKKIEHRSGSFIFQAQVYEVRPGSRGGEYDHITAVGESGDLAKLKVWARKQGESTRGVKVEAA